MKFWIKIVVALGVVLVLGFTVWAFCFREKDEVQAYNRTAELIDYKQSLGVRDKLVELRNTDYMKNNPENKIGNNSSIEKTIWEYRDLCLSEEEIVVAGNITFYSYFVMEDYVDNLMAYYLPYTRSDSSKSKPLKTLKNNIEKYIKSLKNLDESLNSVLEYQKAIEGSETEIEILKGYYESLRNKYRTSLSNATNVVLSLVEYIDISVYSDNLKLDTSFALHDACVRSIKVTTTIESILEPDYAQDVKIILDTIMTHSIDNIFSDTYTEYDFVNSYNKLYNNYKNALDYIFSCKNLEKQQMAEGMALSNVVEAAQDSVVIVLNVLGF